MRIACHCNIKRNSTCSSGMTRINFQPYNTPQLEKIVHARLESAKVGLPPNSPDVIVADGIKFAAMKVSSISGDARRVLDICRFVFPSYIELASRCNVLLGELSRWYNRSRGRHVQTM